MAEGFIARVYSYSLVQHASDTVKSYYSTAKESNSYVKASLETVEQYSQNILHKAEEYSHQPTINNVLHKLDGYGCKQLDKIENGSNQLKQTYEVYKPKTIQSLDGIANKIHGTTVEVGLLKTISLVDTLVDSLFPPAPSEPAEVSRVPEDPNVVARTTPVINKLFERVSTGSIKQLPARSYNLSYDLIFQAENAPQIHLLIGVLTTAALKFKHASENGLQKGAALSKESADYVYAQLTHMANLVGGIVEVMAKLDQREAKATVAELMNMIQNSKANLTQTLGERLDYEGWKKEISAILQKTGDLLATQAAKGYHKAQHSDHATVRKAVASIQSLVLTIVEKFAPAPAPAPTPAPEPSQ